MLKSLPRSTSSVTAGVELVKRGITRQKKHDNLRCMHPRVTKPLCWCCAIGTVHSPKPCKVKQQGHIYRHGQKDRRAKVLNQKDVDENHLCKKTDQRQTMSQSRWRQQTLTPSQGSICYTTDSACFAIATKAALPLCMHAIERQGLSACLPKHFFT